MKILRDFMESFALHEFAPCQERLLCQDAREDDLDLHEQAAENISRHQLLVYFAAATSEQINLRGVLDGEVYGGWFDPASGAVLRITDRLHAKEGILSIRNDSADGKDRVLILTADPEELSVKRGVYAEPRKNENLKKVFEW